VNGLDEFLEETLAMEQALLKALDRLEHWLDEVYHRIESLRALAAGRGYQ